jgi:IS5 family transposase
LTSLLCFKSFLQQYHGLSDFELEKQSIDRISFKHSLISLDTYQTVPQFGHSEREILGQLQSQINGSVANN